MRIYCVAVIGPHELFTVLSEALDKIRYFVFMVNSFDAMFASHGIWEQHIRKEYG